MANSAPFTKSFQKNLTKEIRGLVAEWGHGDILQVGTEAKPMGTWGGQPDIWIARRTAGTGRRIPRVVNIEIEHWSCHAQAVQNVDWVHRWVKAAPAHRASVIHLINATANISDAACSNLFTKGADLRSARFGYDFRVYDVQDGRASAKLAEELVSRYDFQALLWQHLRFVKLAE